MNKFLVVFILSYCSLGFAGSMPFMPKRPLLADQIELIFAKVQLLSTQQVHSCLVDTGARYSLFQEKLIQTLEKVGETLGGGISNTSQVTDLVQASLKVGDWSLESTIGRTTKIPVDCLVGNDFFLTRNFIIDFSKNEFRDLELPLNTEDSYPLIITRSERGGHFGFAMNLAQTEVETIFDTGASATVIDLSFVKTHPTHFKFIKALGVTDGNNVELKAGLYELDEISFGHTRLTKVQIYAMDLTNLKAKMPKVEIVLGMNVIQNYHWQFDMQNARYNYKKN